MWQTICDTKPSMTSARWRFRATCHAPWANANARRAKGSLGSIMRAYGSAREILYAPKGVRHTHMESRSRQSCSYHIDDALAAANAQRLPHEAAGGARCSFLFCFCCCCIPVALDKNIANVYYSHAKRNHRN